ncbi:unnamed protein product [Vitrella brassicaformis CCMP3155]|uniref:Uncharacterized protein n=1 Tax=Vitrella brassicaformis (strain CCMP3155) TaxID=1169540 RepID=A0A0G4G988_VITBC|nr:unnamed protein product [Vitrella brassicaformis CCMP3155]|eukprot:CEM25440.1 unnamed protein product [Vitrella brassicaformis CCMP3155]
MTAVALSLRLSLLIAVCLALYTFPRAHAQCSLFNPPGEFCSLSAGDTEAKEGDIVAFRNVVAGQDLWAKDDVFVEDDLFVNGDRVGAPSANVKARSLTAGNPTDPYAGHAGNIVAERTVWAGHRVVSRYIGSDTHIHAAGRISGGQGCRCGARIISRAFELSATDNLADAEWGGRNRSAAYESFRQLHLRTDPHDRLSLAAKDVSRLFPSAVRTYPKIIRRRAARSGRPST